MRIEGNADERGSEQYNLALGQRRADARQEVSRQPGREERADHGHQLRRRGPKATGHDEEAWKQNRRDDVNAQQPK